MVKRVDVAVYNAFKGTKPGISSLGLKEGGVDYALDQHNAKLVTPEMIQQASKLGRPEVGINEQRVWVVTALPKGNGLMLYIGTPVNAEFLSKQHFAAEDVFDDYRALQGRARSLQLKFNLVLFAIALLIVGIAVWIALAVADRLVRPVGELVDAARRIAGGDLTARVPDPRTRDEVGTLARFDRADVI